MMKKALPLVLFLFASIASADELTARIEKIAATTDATFGVVALDLTTGQKVTIRNDERFPMASVYKFPIALAVLKKVSTGDIPLEQVVTIPPSEFAPGNSPLAKSAKGKPVAEEVGKLLVLALGESDNTASDALLKLIGGPQGVMSYLRFVGVNGIEVSRSEKQIAAAMKKSGAAAFDSGEDTATPDAMAMLLRLFAARGEGLTAFSRNFATDIMRGSTTGANRIRAGVPQGVEVLSKTGTFDGIANEAGIVKSLDGRHRIVMVIFSKGAKKSTLAERETAIAQIAAAIYEEFTKRL